MMTGHRSFWEHPVAKIILVYASYYGTLTFRLEQGKQWMQCPECVPCRETCIAWLLPNISDIAGH